MPQAQYPTILAGQTLTAGLLQALAPFSAWKEVDLPRSNTTTLANDGDLVIPVAANARIEFWGELYAIGAALGTGDLKFTFTWPSGGNGKWSGRLNNTSGAATMITARTASGGGGATALGVNGSSAPSVANFAGMLLNGATQGSLTLQWAQNTSNATATTLQANSWIAAIRTA